MDKNRIKFFNVVKILKLQANPRKKQTYFTLKNFGMLAIVAIVMPFIISHIEIVSTFTKILIERTANAL